MRNKHFPIFDSRCLRRARRARARKYQRLYQGAANQHSAEQQPSEAETILAEVTLVATRRTTMKLARFVVAESPRKVLRFTERLGSRCPFWLARPPSERFCSDRGRTSGHCTSKGELGIEAWLCWRRPI